MSLLFCDGFDWFTTGDGGAPGSTTIYNVWDETSEVGSNSGLNTAYGRNGTIGYTTGVGDNNFLGKNIPNTQTLIAGFGFMRTGNAVGGIFDFLDGTTSQVNVRINSSYILEVYRGSTLLGTATMTGFAIGVFRYIEVKVKFHASTGTVDLRLEGASVLSLTGQNTISTANAYANKIRIGYGGTPCRYAAWDDIYVCNDAGSVNNDFLGDVRVQTLMPSGDGNYSQFTGSDGNSTNNSLLVDEIPQNGDTDYVESATSGNRDTYAFGNVTPTTGVVAGVQIHAIAKKDDAGARSMHLTARVSATDEDTATAYVLSTSYAGYREIRETKPGGGAWSISDINSAEFGVKVG